MTAVNAIGSEHEAFEFKVGCGFRFKFTNIVRNTDGRRIGLWADTRFVYVTFQTHQVLNQTLKGEMGLPW